MLVRLYKSAVVVQNIIILLVIIALWFPRFYAPPTMTTDFQEPFFNFCFGFLQQLPYISMIITLLLLISTAFLEQQSLNFDRLRISGHNFPALLFIVLSATPHVAFFTPITLAALMLAAMLLFLFRIPETLQNDHLIFFAAFFLGIATLFYLPVLFLMLIFLMIYLSGGIPFKKIIVAALGFLFPVIWIAAGLYFASSLSLFVEAWSAHFLTFYLPQPASDMLSFVISLLLISVYFLIIIRMTSKSGERTAIIRRRITISFYLTTLLFVSAFFSYNFYEHLSLLSVPVVALISYYYNEDAEITWIDYALVGCFIMLAVYSFL